MCACLRVLDADDASFGRRVHSSVVRAADCRSAGSWFKSGCALFVVVSKRVGDAEETEREGEREGEGERGRERERERHRERWREREKGRERQTEREGFVCITYTSSSACISRESNPGHIDGNDVFHH